LTDSSVVLSWDEVSAGGEAEAEAEMKAAEEARLLEEARVQAEEEEAHGREQDKSFRYLHYCCCWGVS